MKRKKLPVILNGDNYPEKKWFIDADGDAVFGDTVDEEWKYIHLLQWKEHQKRWFADLGPSGHPRRMKMISEFDNPDEPPCEWAEAIWDCGGE